MTGFTYIHTHGEGEKQKKEEAKKQVYVLPFNLFESLLAVFVFCFVCIAALYTKALGVASGVYRFLYCSRETPYGR